VLQDPRQLNFLGRIGPSPSGGVRVEDASGGTLAAKLGLQAGDILTAINGQPVLSQGDLVRIYSQFDSLGTVRAEIKRNNTPLAITYHIKN
jgi:S1-C subfamily serine protease